MYSQTISYNFNRFYHKKLIKTKINKKSNNFITPTKINNFNRNNSIKNFIKSSLHFNNNANDLNAQTVGSFSGTYNKITDNFNLRNPQTTDNTIKKEDEIIINPKKTILKKLNICNNTLHSSLKNINSPTYYKPKKTKPLIVNKLITNKCNKYSEYENYIPKIIIIQKFVKALIARKISNKNKDKENKYINKVNNNMIQHKNNSKDIIVNRCLFKEKTNVIYSKLNTIKNNNFKNNFVKQNKKDQKIVNNMLDNNKLVKEEDIPICIIPDKKFNCTHKNLDNFENFGNINKNAKFFEKNECNTSIEEKSSFYDDNEFVVIPYDYNKNNKSKKEHFISKKIDLVKINKYILFYEKFRKFILNKFFRIFKNKFKNIVSNVNFINVDNDKTISDNISTISRGRVLVNDDIYNKARTDLITNKSKNIFNKFYIANQYKKTETHINTINYFVFNNGNKL